MVPKYPVQATHAREAIHKASMQHKGPYSYDTRKLCAHLCRELYTQADTGRTRNMICRRLARGLRKEKRGKKQKAEALALRQLTRPQKPRCVGVIDFAIRRGPFYRFVGALPPRDGYSASLGVAGPLTRWPRVTQGKTGGAERYHVDAGTTWLHDDDKKQGRPLLAGCAMACKLERRR